MCNNSLTRSLKHFYDGNPYH